MNRKERIDLEVDKIIEYGKKNRINFNGYCDRKI